MANIISKDDVTNSYPIPQIFQFDNLPVRITDRDGQVWFIANDVCEILEHTNSRRAIERLDEDEKSEVTIKDSLGRQQTVNIISESGLYALVMTSRKAQAKRFKKWVTAEVLPSIRKTGSYHAPATAADNSQNIMVAYSLASSCAKAVSQALFQALISDPEQDIHHCRYALTLTAGHGGNADNVHLQKIPDGSIVTSLESLADKILEPNGIRPSVKELVNLVKACVDRLSKMR